MSSFIICAFYSGNHYEVCAKKLIIDCEKFGYDYDISSPESLKSFIGKRPVGITLRNWICRYKPRFIQDMLDKHNKVIIYMDVDGRVCKEIDPGLFKPYKIGICKELRGSPKIFDAMTSCIVFRDDEVIRQFLDIWERKCTSIDADVADHWFLKTTLLDFCKWQRLKLGYIGGVDVFAALKPRHKPVILLNARRYRRK